MKTRYVLTATLVTLAVSMSYAQRGQGRMGRQYEGRAGGDGQQMHERMMNALELSDEQRAQVRALKLTQRKTNIGQRSQVELKKVELQELLTGAEPNLRQVESKLREMADIRIEVRMSHIRTHQQVRTLLTDEQKVKFDKFKHRMGMGRQGMGGPDYKGRHHRCGMGGQGACDW